MRILAVTGGTAILPGGTLEDATVLCSDGRIDAVGRGLPVPPGAEVVEARGLLVAPGFVDLHVHGGAGADFMDGSAAGALAAIRAHAAHGTTTLFPTTTAALPHELAAALDGVAAAAPDAPGWVPGVHLYGPWSAPENRGSHPEHGVRRPDPGEYLGYLDSGLVAIVSCAPEVRGALELVAAAAERGLLVSIGHTNASWTEAEAAVEAGARHVDHLWCAMSTVPSVRERLGWPQQGSLEQLALLEERLSVEVIADGRHLAPELLRFAWRLKGAARFCLVSDACRALDRPPGPGVLGPLETGSPVESDGGVALADGKPAASVRALDHMVRTAVAAGIPLADAVRAASLTPAERAGIAAETGSLEQGKRADLVLLSPELEVEGVYAGGHPVS